MEKVVSRKSHKLQIVGSTPTPATNFGVWRSLVAHLVWDQGVQGSNPCTPTKIPPCIRGTIG